MSAHTMHPIWSSYYVCPMHLYTFLLTWTPACGSLLHSPCAWHVNLFSWSVSQHVTLIESDLLKHEKLLFFFGLVFKYETLECRRIWTRCNTLFQYSFKPKCCCYYVKYVVNTWQVLFFLLFPIVYMVSCGLKGWHSWQIKLPSESMTCINA